MNADTTRLRLDIAYAGTEYHGWARQNGLDTIQGRIEAAFGLVTGKPIQLTVAGRTDAGVHALGQVAHLEVPTDFWLRVPKRSDEADDQVRGELLAKRINKLLHRGFRVPLSQVAGAEGLVAQSSDTSLQWDDDVVRFTGKTSLVVNAISVVNGDFDARFSALYRRYRYQICDQVAGFNPLIVDLARVSQPLDVRLMHEAAQSFVGEHDFLPFAKPREGATTIRTLHNFKVERDPSGNVVAYIQADAFCHSQVRFMMGALIEIGLRRQPVEWIAELLHAGVRDSRVPLASGRGLTLMAVGYPKASEYGAQALRAKVVRTLA